MGCAKSIPEASQPKQISNQKGNNKSSVAQKAQVKHNQVQVSSEQNKDFRYNENESNSDNESISSRKNNKKKNKQDKEVNMNQQNPAFPSQQLNPSNVNIEEGNNANDNEELLLQQKIQDNQNKFLENLKKQDTQNEFILKSEKNLNNDNQENDDNKENIYMQSNNNEQYIPTQSTKAYGKQESVLNENYCNILRQQSINNNNYPMNSGISINGSINMLNSGSRLQNSNIVTSGLDYEKKKRELIRKVSDDIDEIEEIDENNFQFGATNKESNKLKSNLLKPKKLEYQDDENDADIYLKQQKQQIKQKTDITNNNSKITNINNIADDDDEF
ncbi:hypothetical protein TTHERM_00220780 (macronuclear) [Tetrahymena thermophila SB210]|uniref:Uncharacterized protein n=1 Tax=Tetrahymena thermophila (strain SB210) TaxID=312017 RepID=I7M906_TETTS|nr:hypothetical protein TTHERM_00220780 [Tetrahymena thermophila SB210]EAS00405.1 hypothetical protein TTHERM_00220780 [Tetrahymena thermophila SB210]|eukprot:XP_001020650.1 hypothetical protein TTHERM_00220780 [Tetrahymena thermophila SB210]